jgi:hypothetical protein
MQKVKEYNADEDEHKKRRFWRHENGVVKIK